jgi:hypothetical protein
MVCVRAKEKKCACVKKREVRRERVCVNERER